VTRTRAAQTQYSTDLFLLEPLGWVRDRLSQPSLRDQPILALLLGLDQTRMHVLALTLSQLSETLAPVLIGTLLSDSNADLLSRIKADNIAGLQRILSQLPSSVLEIDDYQALLTLLRNDTTRRHLQNTSQVDGPTIRALTNLPAELRTPAVMALLKQVQGMEHFPLGLRFLSERSGFGYVALITHFRSLGQTEQIAASLRRLIDSLPLPEVAPPAQIGSFLRVDGPRELRQLAKDWRNCLADCIFSVDDGSSAVYVSAPHNAVCLVTRHGRMGWFLHQVKGPRNAEIAPDKLNEIRADFSQAGIFAPSIIEAITTITTNRGWKSRSLDAHFDVEAFIS
jgi:hypothetical protein